MFKATFRFKVLFIGFFFTFFLKGGLEFFAQTTQTFNYTGSNQTFVVPSCVSTMTVQAWGGAGGGGGGDTYGGSDGGGGAYTTSTIAVTSGTSLTIIVGGGGGAGTGCAGNASGGTAGFGLGNGGAGGNAGVTPCSGSGGGGGGGTGIMNGAAILLVAGGGGGGGGGGQHGGGANGGGGGQDGMSANSSAYGILGASGSTSGIAGVQTNGDGAGGGGGGGGLVGGGGGGVPGTDYGGSGGAGGTSNGTSTNGSGTTPGNSAVLSGICGACSIGGQGSAPSAAGNPGGNGVLIIKYNGGSPPTGIITNGPATCSAATATVAVSGGTPGYTYTWSPTGGNAAATNNLTTSGTYTASFTDAGGCVGTSTTNIAVLSTALTGTIANGPGTCGVANATVTPTNGTPAYTYTWSPTGGNSAAASNLSAGGYTVGFTDANGCIGAATTNIVVPPGLNMSLTGPVNPYCDTTKLDWVTWSSVTATSGIGTVSSNLSISLTKPSGGLFTTPSLFASGNFPPQYNLPINNTTLGNTQAGLFTFCFSKPVIDPQVAFSSIGQAGIPVPINTSVPYTVIWSGYGMTYPSNTTLVGAEGYTIIQFPGQHTCIDFNYLTSENYCNLVFGIRDTNCQTTPICKGSAATFTASGGVSYTWSPNVALSATTGSVVTMSPTSYQTYTVIGTDINGCHDTAITSITVNSLPVPTVSSFTNVSCFGGNNGAALVSVTNGLAPYHYLWTNGNTSIKDSMLIAGNYNVTVTDSNGCKGSTAQIITQPAVLKDSIATFSNLSCFGIPNGSATVGVRGGTTPYTYSWNTTPAQLTATASNLFVGSYTVTVNDANLCSTTATVTLTQPPALTLTATQSNVTCFGLSTGSATATAIGGTTPYTYAWNTAPPQISTTGIAIGLAAGQYTAGVQDGKGCQDTVSITITQPALLVGSIVSSKNDSCFGASNGNAVTGSNGGTMPYTYLWNTTPPQSTPTANNLPAGTYTATITDAHNCKDTAVVTITQPALFVASITSFKNDSCFGTSNGNAVAGVTGGTTPYLYAWSTTPPQLNNTAVNLSVGIYTVGVKDAQGCIATVTINITQPPALTLTTSQINVSCNGLNDASITTTAAGGTLPYIYALEQPVQITPTGIFTGLIAGQYTTGVIDANGCRDSVQVIITQPAVLVDSLVSQKNDSCFGNSNGNAVIGSSGGTPPYSYLWNTTPPQTTTTTSNLPAGPYTATVTDAHGCKDTAAVIITQPPILTASIVSSKNDSCFGNSNGNVVATGNGGTRPYFYSWNTAPVQLDSIASNLSIGNYTATLTDIKGCVTTTTVTITQPPLLTVSSPAKIICISNTATLTANQVGGTAPYTYLWNSVAGVQTNTVNPITTTVYSVQVNDIKGCTTTNTVTVFVRDSLKFLAISPGAEKCNGFSANINATGSGGDSLFTYTWNPGGLIGQNVTVTPSTTTIYTLTLTDNCGTPPIKTTVPVIIDPLPQINFTSDKQNGCYPLCVQFANTTTISSTDAITYSWDDGKHTSTITNPSWCYNASGVFTVSLTATSSKGCISKTSIPNMITVYPHPVAKFYTAPDSPTILESTIQFTDASYAPGSSMSGLFWQTFGDGTDSTSALPNPSHTYRDTGTYCITLIATNAFGCKDITTDCIYIKPYFTLYIPNAFSPNNDGDNDVFAAVGDYIFDFDMRIYDRWGNLVYHTTQVNSGWNGLMKGGAAIEDVYVYVISATDYHNKSYSYKGTVTLLK